MQSISDLNFRPQEGIRKRTGEALTIPGDSFDTEFAQFKKLLLDIKSLKVVEKPLSDMSDITQQVLLGLNELMSLLVSDSEIGTTYFVIDQTGFIVANPEVDLTSLFDSYSMYYEQKLGTLDTLIGECNDLIKEFKQHIVILHTAQEGLHMRVDISQTS
ncbi:MAG TPA: hypothetical protein PLW93_00805 [Candidatus Absconditabacterales bacterium]|nr:hypothetical protein [Candidatus Absconditabacterales bacterium]HNG96790.1 hypothetical protein [Candidatus Absconditabacterales bacterium]